MPLNLTLLWRFRVERAVVHQPREARHSLGRSYQLTPSPLDGGPVVLSPPAQEEEAYVRRTQAKFCGRG